MLQPHRKPLNNVWREWIRKPTNSTKMNKWDERMSAFAAIQTTGLRHVVRDDWLSLNIVYESQPTKVKPATVSIPPSLDYRSTGLVSIIYWKRSFHEAYSENLFWQLRSKSAFRESSCHLPRVGNLQVTYIIRSLGLVAFEFTHQHFLSTNLKDHRP